MKNIYLLILLSNHFLFGQAFSFNSLQNGESIKHRILMDNEYFVETQFVSSSNKFVKTIGGFYQKNENDIIQNTILNGNQWNNDIVLLIGYWIKKFKLDPAISCSAEL